MLYHGFPRHLKARKFTLKKEIHIKRSEITFIMFGQDGCEVICHIVINGAEVLIFKHFCFTRQVIACAQHPGTDIETLRIIEYFPVFERKKEIA